MIYSMHSEYGSIDSCLLILLINTPIPSTWVGAIRPLAHELEYDGQLRCATALAQRGRLTILRGVRTYYNIIIVEMIAQVKCDISKIGRQKA